MSKKEKKAALAKFTTAELQDEIDRREAEEADAKKDTKRRKFYRLVEQKFKTPKEKARWIAGLPDEQTVLEEDGLLYILDDETDEELRLRLSRTAKLYWKYDHHRCTFWEDGEETEDIGLDGPYESYVEEWENRGDEWDETQRLEYIGHNSWRPTRD